MAKSSLFLSHGILTKSKAFEIIYTLSRKIWSYWISKKLITEKQKFFLDDKEKPPRLPSNYTITLDYTSPKIEQYICNLTRKIS